MQDFSTLESNKLALVVDDSKMQCMMLSVLLQEEAQDSQML